MNIKELKTAVRNGFHGKSVETTTTEKGQTFDITTMKRHNGHVTTSVTKVNKKSSSDGMMVTSFGMNDTAYMFDHGKFKRVTEKVLLECHYKGLAMFEEKIPEIKVQETIEIGDIIFLDDCSKTKGSRGNDHIVYDIEDGQWGTTYKCVERTTFTLSSKDHIRPFSEKFGIGSYFVKGYDMKHFGITDDDLANMLIEAQEVKKKADERRKKEQEEANKKAQEKKEYLSQFKQADRRKTTSIVKSHCVKNYNISKIQVSTDVFSGGDSMDVRYYSPEPIKELESFIKGFQYGRFNGMEDIYEHNENQEDIIIDGFILQDYKYVSVDWCEGPGKPKEEITPDKVDADVSLEIVDYSERSFVVIGDTKPIKDLLKSLGGKFNFRLSCGPGWVFSKNKEVDVRNALGLVES